ncbi:hypothetical protein I9Y19_004482 [Citrobacter freundii]|uniref:Uncharacterized protein n=1 Tax=Citrobacter freundii TaxID=546 RepID=A0ABY7KV68_CITFR|nr:MULTISPECIES: hypothetical protein [Citrobacter]EIJ9082570.1 hypothetical protein [Citrobacter freundii]EJH9545210.1 hypothetical protein [Citrobacter freundii]EJO6481080.1 hypothetical protein [Citrobacter freundii]EKW5683738.1 hypothetical protein [Citrobacter freundii]EKX5708237.1 hypothetical protein [Citrobacter freundii]
MQVRAFFSHIAQPGGDIAPLKVSALLIAGSGMDETYHAGFLHQITPDPPVQIAGNDLHSGLLFLKQPAAEAIIHCPVLRSLRGIAPGNDALKQGMLARCCESGSITNGV